MSIYLEISSSHLFFTEVCRIYGQSPGPDLYLNYLYILTWSVPVKAARSKSSPPCMPCLNPQTSIVYTNSHLPTPCSPLQYKSLSSVPISCSYPAISTRAFLPGEPIHICSMDHNDEPARKHIALTLSARPEECWLPLLYKWTVPKKNNEQDWQHCVGVGKLWKVLELYRPVYQTSLEEGETSGFIIFQCR